MVHPCQENTATFDPDRKEYGLFFTSSVPNISAKPDTSYKHRIHNNEQKCYIFINETVNKCPSYHAAKLSPANTIKTVCLLDSSSLQSP